MSKLALRRTWFRVHQWIGVALALLIIPISLSGAVLVWDEEIEHAIHPERFAVSGEGRLDAPAYLAAARAAIGPGDRIVSLTLPKGGEAATVNATAAPGGSVRSTVYLDPPTARVMDVARSNEGMLRFLHVLHGNLYLPGLGRQVVGWIGVAMMLSALTGLWLWWPATGGFTRGLRWRRRADIESNLHHRFGFWIALPLFVLAATGAYISFPQFVGRLSGEVRAGAPSGRPVPVAEPALEMIELLAAANSEAVTSIAWPTDRKPAWTLRIGADQLSIDDATRAITREPAPAPGLARLMRRIHDGTGMSIVWRVVIFAGGLLPALLAVTGVLMWWRSRGLRARAARRPERETATA